jgi:hypothetical protein
MQKDVAKKSVLGYSLRVGGGCKRTRQIPVETLFRGARKKRRMVQVHILRSFSR